MVVPQVSATNFGSAGTGGTSGLTNGVWLTGDPLWSVAKRALTAAYSTGVNDALWDEYAPTDLTLTVSSPSSCSDDDYDLCVFDDNYGDNGVNGWNACAGVTGGSHPNQVCSLDWVRINLFYGPPPKRIACHEIGHSVGLQHTSDQASCMKSTGDGGNSEVLTSHDKAHLNAAY